MRITMRDIRAAKMCSRGARQFFDRHGLDWADFVRNGVLIEIIEKIDDAMAQQVVGVAREQRQ